MIWAGLRQIPKQTRDCYEQGDTYKKTRVLDRALSRVELGCHLVSWSCQSFRQESQWQRRIDAYLYKPDSTANSGCIIRPITTTGQSNLQFDSICNRNLTAGRPGYSRLPNVVNAVKFVPGYRPRAGQPAATRCMNFSESRRIHLLELLRSLIVECICPRNQRTWSGSTSILKYLMLPLRRMFLTCTVPLPRG